MLKLTKDQIKALKTADCVCFRRVTNKENNSITETIELHKKVKDSPWNEEKTIIIELTASNSITFKQFDAFSMIGSCQFDNCYMSITKILKVGDELTLSWEKDYLTSNLLKDAGLHGDVLLLKITRENKSLTFNINQSITLNNSARMIQML